MNHTPTISCSTAPAFKRVFQVFAACLMLATPLSRLAAAADTSSAHWRAQKLEFTYSGFTARYSCDGIEGKVREILLSFGARKDLKVKATGCEQGGGEATSKIAWVATDFSALAPGPDPEGAATVNATWARAQLAPNRPNFMGTGECELVDAMRELLQKGFALRNVVYRADCVPKHVSIADYSVNAEVLKPAAN